MGTFTKKIKEGILTGFGIGVGFLVIIGVFGIAYASYSWVTQSDVITGDNLTASSWNNMLNNQNFLKQEVENIDTTGFLTKVGDTMGGELNMGTNKITSLATPTATTDATTKAYVDSVSAGGYSGCIPITSEGIFKNTIGTYGIPKSIYYNNEITSNIYKISGNSTNLSYYYTNTNSDSGNYPYATYTKFCY